MMPSNPTGDPAALAEQLRQRLPGKIEFDKPLAPMTSFRTGGPARYFVLCNTEAELTQAVTAVNELQIDFFMLGGGSNLLVSDSGFDGLIIKIDVKGLTIDDEGMIVVGAGEDLMGLVHFATANSLTGLEFASGIWGSVGGAIYGNAGAYGGQVGSLVHDLNLIDSSGKSRVVAADYCRFGYRDSYLKKTKEIVVSSRFALRKGDQKTIADRVDEIMAVRNVKFPPDGLSAGCFFKNIPDQTQPHGKMAAGKLLDEIGAKSIAVGGAKVYNGHANVILNSGTATSKEISDLADKLKKKVLDKFGIILEEEIIRIGHFQT